ncbi:hypothetical protein Zmor_000651 [Zophobas morio]|uniref:Uncharacterized protein n=1 Tax=Zophobas morio TaxID=2755281 RepID=A0AA38MRM0_9CUCU|nr:hypothetical protein Zmor_000651 [Zophobas morio]
MSACVPIEGGQDVRRSVVSNSTNGEGRHDEGRIGVKCCQTFIFNATSPLKSMDKYFSSSSKKWVSSDRLYITLRPTFTYAANARAPLLKNIIKYLKMRLVASTIMHRRDGKYEIEDPFFPKMLGAPTDRGSVETISMKGDDNRVEKKMVSLILLTTWTPSS